MIGSRYAHVAVASSITRLDADTEVPEQAFDEHIVDMDFHVNPMEEELLAYVEHTWSGTRGGVDEETCTVACPWHLWEWNLEDRTHEASGQRIGTFDTEVANGSVFVRI